MVEVRLRDGWVCVLRIVRFSGEVKRHREMDYCEWKMAEGEERALGAIAAAERAA